MGKPSGRGNAPKRTVHIAEQCISATSCSLGICTTIHFGVQFPISFQRRRRTMARKTPEEQKADLLKRKAQLEERLKAIGARENSQKRKDDTRRKILVSALCLAHAEHKPEFKKWLAEALSKSLEKPADIALFSDWLSDFESASLPTARPTA